MVSGIYKPTKKRKATSAAELETKIQSKDSKRLEETTKDYKRLHQSKGSTKRLQETWQLAIQ